MKFTSDGLIAYFPAPSFLTKNDLALDCALTLLRLVYEGINPALRDLGLPDLAVRIGIDSGKAAIVMLGSLSTKRQSDILGEVINLACKIQSRAPVGGVAMGEATFRNLHTDWRVQCSEFPLHAGWIYTDGSKEGVPYPLYQLKRYS